MHNGMFMVHGCVCIKNETGGEESPARFINDPLVPMVMASVGLGVEVGRCLRGGHL